MHIISCTKRDKSINSSKYGRLMLFKELMKCSSALCVFFNRSAGAFLQDSSLLDSTLIACLYVRYGY